jgi:hypothetical protein
LIRCGAAGIKVLAWRFDLLDQSANWRFDFFL